LTIPLNLSPLTLPIITLTDVSFTYREGTTAALKEISYSHHRGDFTVIIGETGAGKSTFCRCLNGLIPSFIKGTIQGEYKVSGIEKANTLQVHELARIVGLVFQDFEAQLFSTNVELETAFSLENFSEPPENMPNEVARALNQVGLVGFEHRDPSSLSGGEKQRLAIASVLAGKPKLVVMDEPTTDLDPIGKREIFELSQNLRKNIGGIILVEHETEHILTADRVLLMHEGQITREGRPTEILSDPKYLEQCGVRPLQRTILLSRLGLGIEIFTIPETVKKVLSAGWKVKKNANKILQSNQKQKSDVCVAQVKNLTFKYDKTIAIDNVSLDIMAGEFVALVGQNGCGKTTLAKHLNGLHKPQKGEVHILGKSIMEWTLPELGRRVGYVFQNPDHQIFANTILDEVAFGPRNFGLTEKNVKDKVFAALAATGLENREMDDPFSLTRGERQQLAVASVLATDPDILVLDEPTTGLDYHGQLAILGLIQRLNNTGMTVIIITHSMWVVSEYADRCIIMSRGRLVQDAEVRLCFQNPEALESLYLEAPEAVRLGYEFGLVVRSIEELVDCLEI
tara:strand:- start:106273 stop:107979 length:1707 start_codon:yes stop_codon:yes gene_type:complete